MPSTSNVAPRKIGHVKFFNSVKGYGFIIPDDSTADQPIVEVFVHHTAINGNGFKSLAEGEEVEYDMIQGPKGMQAANVSGPGGVPVQGDPNARRPYQNYHRRFQNNRGSSAAAVDGRQYGYPTMYGMMPPGGGAAAPPPPYGYTAFYGPYPAAAAAAPPPPPPQAATMNGQDNNGPNSPPALFRQHAHHHHPHHQQQPMFAYSYQPGISGAAVSDTSAVYPHSPPTPMAMYYPYPQQQPYFIPSTMQGFVSASASSTSSSNQSASSISNNTTPTCEHGPSTNNKQAQAPAAVHQMAVAEIPT